MSLQTDYQPSYGEKLRAWAVHLFTACGAVAGLIAVIHVLHGEPSRVLLWMVIALAIDGIDGPLARRFQVSTVLPQVDGVVLDHVIDYTNYALIPAIFLYEFSLVPAGWELAAAATAVVTSLYCFINKGMKTKDNFFSGFPAAWNVVILCFYVLETPPAWNLALVPLIALLTFTSLKFIHPLRVRALRPLTIGFTLLWAALALYMVLELRTGGGLRQNQPMVYWAFAGTSLNFIIISLIRSLRGSLEIPKPRG